MSSSCSIPARFARIGRHMTRSKATPSAAVAAIGSMTINIGFFVLLSLFAAVILGGIGNAYGALVGGLLIGLVQEWSTLLFDARWKVLVSFGVLILVLIVRPQGIFGRDRTV